MITLTPAMESALSGAHTFCNLIELRFNGITVYLTDSATDITYSGSTYLGNGLLTNVSAFKQREQLNAIEYKLAFTAADLSIISIILNNDQLNREILVKRATLNPVNAQVIPDPIEVGKFLITGASINDAKIGSVTLTMSNFWSDFERISGITTTQASAQRHYPNETGFINAIDIDKELEWGGQ